MLLRLAFVFALFVLAACNLSDSPQRTPRPPETEETGATPTPAAPTALPGVNPATANPNALPTRTPMNGGAQSIVTPLPLTPLTVVTPGAQPTGAVAGQSSDTPVVSITMPPANSTFSGSGTTMNVSGTAGGIPENQFALALVTPEGRTLSSITITLTNTDYRRIVSWSASMDTTGYRGAAELRALSTAVGNSAIYGSVRITIQ
jgi:hypothetical protein